MLTLLAGGMTPCAVLLSSAPSPLASSFRDAMILAPLTRGGNLPFRRWCAEYGMTVSVGEMVFARALLKGDRIEKTRLNRAANERFFGVQIATNDVDEGRRAVAMAAEAGADWVDLNCGCPIYEATRRGLGSALLRRPERLAALVEGIARDSPLPLSVKVRLAPEGHETNVREVARLLREAGAAAVTIHGRTAQDRYTRAADWQMIKQVVDDGRAAGSAIPIVGNGDVLTHWEATRRIEASGVDAVMVGRGALIKPWLFGEYARREAWEPTAAERVAAYRQLVAFMKEHFGDDARGRAKAWKFLPWHFDFLTRYRHCPADVPTDHSLLQTRLEVLSAEDHPPLDRVLACRSPAVHEQIAAALWDADADADAVLALEALVASGALDHQPHDAATPIDGDGADDELTNVPSERAERQRAGKGRGRREPPPQRTPEEIAELRAQRAAKRLLTGAPPHVNAARR